MDAPLKKRLPPSPHDASRETSAHNYDPTGVQLQTSQTHLKQLAVNTWVHTAPSNHNGLLTQNPVLVGAKVRFLPFWLVDVPVQLLFWLFTGPDIIPCRVMRARLGIYISPICACPFVLCAGDVKDCQTDQVPSSLCTVHRQKVHGPKLDYINGQMLQTCSINP